jgi:hypothetical protein
MKRSLTAAILAAAWGAASAGALQPPRGEFSAAVRNYIKSPSLFLL